LQTTTKLYGFATMKVASRHAKTAVMCGRFTASFEFREIKLLFNLQRDIPLLIRRYNIAPSQEVPVIVQNAGVNELKPMKWGLVPGWAPDSSIGNNIGEIYGGCAIPLADPKSLAAKGAQMRNQRRLKETCHVPD
jgi:putative SOS response-associated peptidase YedK